MAKSKRQNPLDNYPFALWLVEEIDKAPDHIRNEIVGQLVLREIARRAVRVRAQLKLDAKTKRHNNKAFRKPKR